jgi:DnaJ-class molecular chaperone
MSYSEWRHNFRFHPSPHATHDAELFSHNTQAFSSLIDEVLGGFVPEVTARPADSPKDLMVELRLTSDEALHGGTHTVMVPIQKRCPACLGSGLGGTLHSACARCSGRGYDLQKHEFEVVVPPGTVDGEQAVIPLLSQDVTGPSLRVLVTVV